jgi:hypothetical protein
VHGGFQDSSQDRPASRGRRCGQDSGLFCIDILDFLGELPVILTGMLLGIKPFDSCRRILTRYAHLLEVFGEAVIAAHLASLLLLAT